ncbi:receptor-type tyrosine-protein kinase FLT3-like isoform X2 [Pocillopora verrucosa]
MTGNYTLINFHSGNSSYMTWIGFVLRFEAVDQPVQPSICPIGWYHQHGSSCYKFSFDSLTWNQASRHCQSLGGYLVKIDDDKEQSYITNKIKEMRLAEVFWIGLHDPDKDNNYKWVYDDTPPRYSNWNENEPNNKASDCARAYGIWFDLYGAPFPAGKWNGVSCSEKTFSICEKNATVAAPDIMAKTPTLAIKTQKNEAMSSVALIYSLVGATIVVILVLCCIMGLRCYKSKRHARLKRHVQRPFREIIPLDKWEILPKQVHYEEELGRGAFGVVYKATLTRRAGIEVFETRERLKPEKQCQVVAVKVLQGDPTDEQREAFLHEILQMKLLGSHQNIVSLVGCCTLQDTNFLVIEYVPYGDLLQWLRQKRRSVNKNQALRGKEAEKFYEDRDTPIDELKRCKPSRKSCDSAVNQENIELMSMPSSPGYYNHAAVISLSTVNLHESNLDGVNDNDDVGVDGFSAQQLFSFAWQVARGMNHLAENDFVHRDLAARNILVGQDGRVKVSDFGLMRQVYEDVYSIKKAKKLPVKWMAPESIFEGVFTIKSDVWSYGIFLWEMATMGGVPYPTFTNTELCKLLKNGYRMEKPDMCCHEVYEMMTSCWENDPTTRPSFSELIDRLEAIMTRDVTYCDMSNCDESSPYYNIQDMVDEESG